MLRLFSASEIIYDDAGKTIAAVNLATISATIASIPSTYKDNP